VKITGCRATVISSQFVEKALLINLYHCSKKEWEGNQKSGKSGNLPNLFDDFYASAKWSLVRLY